MISVPCTYRVAIGSAISLLTIENVAPESFIVHPLVLLMYLTVFLMMYKFKILGAIIVGAFVPVVYLIFPATENFVRISTVSNSHQL